MNGYSFLIIHGLGGSGPDHWQTWLYDELIKRKFNVCYPTFSDFDCPNKDVWLDELSSSLKSLPDNHRKIVITHSLGGLLWQHFAAIHNKKYADHVILVAPPSPKVVIPEVSSFYPVPLNGNHLAKVANETLFVHSNNDHYCSVEDSTHYLKLNVPSIIFPNMGHINTVSGHGKWPWILDLCMNITNNKTLLSI